MKMLSSSLKQKRLHAVKWLNDKIRMSVVRRSLQVPLLKRK